MSEESEIRKLVEQIQRASEETKIQFDPELERIRDRQRERSLEHPEMER
jgi:hypothetical protein